MKRILSIVLLGLSINACESEDTKIATQDDETLYTMGQMYARRIEYLNLSKKESDLLLKGARDWLQHKKSEVDFEKNRFGVQLFVTKRTEAIAEVEKEKGKAYLEKFLKEEGAKITESGLAYKIIKEGSNVKSSKNDTVEVDYHGTLIDGTVFDSSVERKTKANFGLNQVIKGWKEGIQLIGEGGEIKLVIPPDLAYGDRGSPPKIPGGATLVFDITLYKVTKS